MLLLPALTDTTVCDCLMWASCGPASISQYAYWFSITAKRVVTIDETWEIVNAANFRAWAQDGYPKHPTIGEITRSDTTFWKSSL